MSDEMALAVVSPAHEQERESLVVWAKTVQITTPEVYQEVVIRTKGIKALQKAIENDFAETVRRAHEAHKGILRQRDAHLQPLRDAEGAIKRKISAWATEQERKQREEENRLWVAAQKRLEDERLAQAEKIAAAGDKKMADAILEEPVVAPPVVIPEPAVPKVQGMAFRETWKHEITNADTCGLWLVQNGHIPVAVMDKIVGGLARKQKGATRIPGVRVWPEKEAAIGT